MGLNLFKTKEKTHELFVSFDMHIFIITIMLMLFGLFIQLNIGSSRGTEHSLQFFNKQLLFFAVSLPIIVFIGKSIKLINFLHKHVFLLLILNIFLLLAVLLIGTTTKGGTRWIRFGSIGVQPSMIASTILIIYISKIIEKKQNCISQSTFLNFLKDFSPIIILSIIVFGLVLWEKHLSTLVVLGATIFGMLFVANIRFSTLISIILVVLILFVAVLKMGDSYRSSRMDIYSKYSLFYKLFGQSKEKENINDYQVKESLTALSSGHIFGTGVSKGRAKHYFLPDAKSDYVFAVIGEQFGFIGAILILITFVYLFLRSWKVSWNTHSIFTKMIGMGVSLNIFFTAMVNIGVAISAIPPTGLTLPFISYGGSSMLMNAVNIGIILNLSSKRKVI